MSLAINARFLTQPVTGVQRFAAEIVAALAALHAAGEAPQPRLLAPRGAPATFAGLPVEITGIRAGQAWEQLELPRAAGAGLLLNLGNTAPLRGGRRAVVIHDAGAFDTPDSYTLAFRSWYRALHLALPRSGARIVTVSGFSRARLAVRLRISPDRIAVIPEGGEHILRLGADTSGLARHGLHPNGYALAVGTRAAHKGLEALRGAAEVLAARGMVLAVAGATNAAVFGTDAAPTGASIRALGRVSDAELRALYENAFCLLFPSRYEGFGLPPLEAMWCGCPVIASRSGAVPEVSGDAALWFGDAEAAPAPPPQPSPFAGEGGAHAERGRERGFADAASALTHLLGSPSLRDSLRSAGAARARAYTWPAAARALLAAIA